MKSLIRAGVMMLAIAAPFSTLYLLAPASSAGWQSTESGRITISIVVPGHVSQTKKASPKLSDETVSPTPSSSETMPGKKITAHPKASATHTRSPVPGPSPSSKKPSLSSSVTASDEGNGK